MKFDQILYTYLGEFGRYQKILFILVCIPTIWTAIHSLSWTFTAAVIPHRCKLHGENDSAPFKINASFPGEDKNKRCQRYIQPDPQSNLSQRSIGIESCKDGYIWDLSDLTNTAINRWTIVCDQSYIRAVVQSMYYVGQFVGSFVFGYIADKCGRKKIFIFAILMQIICGTAMAFMPYWPIFGMMRMGLGFVHPGVFVIANVIGIEFLGPSKRKLAGVVTHICYEIGNIILGLTAYGIRDYQHLQVAISLPALFMLSYYWIIPESPRWLISQGRVEEAGKILETAAKVNKVLLPDNWRDQLDVEDTKRPTHQYTIADLVKFPNIRRRLLISMFCWPVVSMTYYGIQMNPSFLGGGRYFTFLITAAMAIPGCIIVQFTLDRWGRRVLASGGFLICSLCLLSTLIIPETIFFLRLIQLCISKSAITAAYCVMYIFTPELFPTALRGTATGFCSMIARVGSVSAGFISMWLVNKTKWAAVLIFGPFTLTAGILAMFLPETKGKPLPETIEDAENNFPNPSIVCCKKGSEPVTMDIQMNEENKKQTDPVL